MAAKKTAAKAGGKVIAARNSPYVQQLLEDEELRETIKTAYESAREAYGRLSNGKAPGKVIFEDKKLHQNINDTAAAVKDARNSLVKGQKKPKRRIGRTLLLLIVGGGAVLGFSEGARKAVLDALFGKEEEFDYTATTAPPPPAPPVDPVVAPPPPEPGTVGA